MDPTVKAVLNFANNLMRNNPNGEAKDVCPAIIELAMQEEDRLTTRRDKFSREQKIALYDYFVENNLNLDSIAGILTDHRYVVLFDGRTAIQCINQINKANNKAVALQVPPPWVKIQQVQQLRQQVLSLQQSLAEQQNTTAGQVGDAAGQVGDAAGQCANVQSLPELAVQVRQWVLELGHSIKPRHNVFDGKLDGLVTWTIEMTTAINSFNPGVDKKLDTIYELLTNLQGRMANGEFELLSNEVNVLAGRLETWSTEVSTALNGFNPQLDRKLNTIHQLVTDLQGRMANLVSNDEFEMLRNEVNVLLASRLERLVLEVQTIWGQIVQDEGNTLCQRLKDLVVHEHDALFQRLKRGA